MKKEYLAIMGILLLIGIYIGMEIQESIFPRTEITKIHKEKYEITKPNTTTVKTNLVAVDEKGRGVTADLEVMVEPGDGKVLVDIDNLLFWLDTQFSIRTAEKMARNYLNLTDSRYNIIYTVNANSTIVGGPSAGAMLTLATIMALQNKSLDHKIAMTGTVNPDGSIGPVGGILAKAYAAKEAGYETLLVPEGQGKKIYYEKKEECKQYENLRVCSTDYEPKEMSIEKEAGIDVKEVSNIKEALKYFK